MHSTNNIIILCLALLFSSPVFSQKRIVILHTNDTHSRIEPLPKTDKTAPGKGGVERRASFINEVRRENRNVLLLDAGDFVQGTPYFNLFKGEVEVKAMNLMKYDAATLGNHEFDYGLEVLEEIIRKADFPVITSNYDFSQTGKTLCNPEKRWCADRYYRYMCKTSGINCCRKLQGNEIS